jgi:RimJ/RimL family protein N-acetyltransferase
MALAFSAGAKRVFAQTMAVNDRSRAVMTRLGLVYARTFHLDLDDPLPGAELGEVEYELTRAGWERGSGSVRPLT